ncbi:MAG: hypothetical protein Q8N51_12645 [Gammaproteobacteria bacterium]|nr:hypothetical protein [Gammaproteobacteria bacterium]
MEVPQTAHPKLRYQHDFWSFILQWFGLGLAFLNAIPGALLGYAIAGWLGSIILATAGFLFPGGIMFYFGERRSRHWTCSNCGNPIADNQVRLCPTCRVPLHPAPYIRQWPPGPVPVPYTGLKSIPLPTLILIILASLFLIGLIWGALA